MRLLFVHGAGGYDDDRPLAEALAGHLDADLDYPHLSDDDMSLEAWAAPIRQAVAQLGPRDLLVAHSFGASVTLAVLAELAAKPASAPGAAARAATLLAMPDWSADGWQVPEYDHPASLQAGALTLHHCRDDEIVPFDHTTLHLARLPGATLVAHDKGGHQFVGLDKTVAESLVRSPEKRD